MKSNAFAFTIAAIAVFPLFAALELGTPFSDGAVLQRGKPLPVWGKADAGARVTVEFGGNSASATAGEDGAWRVDLPAMEASAEGRTLKVSSANESVAVKDVLVGEVWLCSGQSNMECPIWGENPHFRDGKGAMMTKMVNLPAVRFVKNPRTSVRPGEPSPIVRAAWHKFVPESFNPADYANNLTLSADAFYFARELHFALGVPVGVVDSSWGGTDIAQWLPGRAGRLFNGMVAPYAPMAVRGLLWYQGCADAGRKPEKYADNLRSLADGWRGAFGNPEMPIYVCRLAPWKQTWRDIWFAQEEFAAADKNAHLVTLSDVGNEYDIHPNDKETVGQRLAAAALAGEYGFKGLDAASPTLKDWKIDGTAFILSFDQELYVYTPDFRPTQAFEVAGADGKWFKAKIEEFIRPSQTLPATIRVSSAHVKEPMALRYALSKPFVSTLYGANAIPVAAFELKAEGYVKTTGDSALIPVPAEVERADWWTTRHEGKLKEIKRSGGAYDVVMIGDSITHFAEAKPERGGEAYAAFTNTYKVLNLGYGGDRTQNVIWRIINGELSCYRTKVFTLMIGTNNNDWGQSEPDETALGIKRIVDMIRERQPQAKIILMPIFPRGRTPDDPANRKNQETNMLIKPLADGENIIWLDFNDKFLGSDGKVPKALMGDFLHPTAEGYKIMFDALAPIIKEATGR